MIAHLTGKLDHKDNSHVIIEVNRIGYLVTIPSTLLPRLPEVGKEIKLFTSQVVREDDISLFGFLTIDERNLFQILLKVSGVGPKTACALVGAFDINKLVAAITKGEVDLITSVPGIGKKTAQKIVIDLREKVEQAFGDGGGGGGKLDLFKGKGQEVQDAVSALIALGYGTKEAENAVARLDPSILAQSTENIIRQALIKII